MSERRIAKIDTFWPNKNYLVCYATQDVEVTEAELEALDRYRQYLRQRFYTPQEIQNMDNSGEVDVCVGNGNTFLKRSDGSWAYKKWTWQDNNFWPHFGTVDFHYTDVSELINKIEEKSYNNGWENFQLATH
jgi:hypothetical protein